MQCCLSCAARERIHELAKRAPRPSWLTSQSCACHCIRNFVIRKRMWHTHWHVVHPNCSPHHGPVYARNAAGWCLGVYGISSYICSWAQCTALNLKPAQHGYEHVAAMCTCSAHAVRGVFRSLLPSKWQPGGLPRHRLHEVLASSTWLTQTYRLCCIEHQQL